MKSCRISIFVPKPRKRERVIFLQNGLTQLIIVDQKKIRPIREAERFQQTGRKLKKGFRSEAQRFSGFRKEAQSFSLEKKVHSANSREKMGKATRWFKGLLGMKKEKAEQPENSKLKALGKNETRKLSFTKSVTDSSAGGKTLLALAAAPSSDVSSADSAWIRSFIVASEKDQNKHAIAVAAATAAAADAAVAAAQAAVAVVQLTSHGGGSLFLSGREKLAAVKIQTFFRSYLARKALRALRGLVKIQALVRGFLVRKQAAATLHRMQALVRAQVAVRSERARRSFNHDNRLLRQIQSVKSIEETRSEFHSKRAYASYGYTIDEIPKIVEVDTCKPRSRSRRFTSAFSERGEDSPRISVPDCRHIQDFEYCFMGDDCKFSTAQSTPRLATPLRCNVPSTPSKSVAGNGLFRQYLNFPNYMVNTESFNAKLRSHSAPKQRPEPGSKKRLSLNELIAARNSLSGVKMQRPNYQIEN